jgi:F420-dependent oxidoreductase-like protein
MPLTSSPVEMLADVELAIAADGLGYDVVWVPEAYGWDAATMLATIAARTSRIGIGSGVFQIPARTPAMTGMTAATLDILSGGRFRLGLGVSGPQVSEGWHGVRFADPLGRTEEYVGIVRSVLSRKRVSADGPHFTLPLPDGPGKSLALALQTLRSDIPIYLAAVGPKNLQLTGRIADGWLGIFFDAETGSRQIEAIRSAAVGAGRDPADIDISVSVPVSVADDPATAAARVRPYAALYIGGMGSRKQNFYHAIAAAMGYAKEADEVQDRFLSRDYAGAAAAVPFEFLDRTCLLGDESRIAAGLRRLADAGVVTATVHPSNASVTEQIEVLGALHRIVDSTESASASEAVGGIAE